MIDAPLTKKEAESIRYRCWASNPSGTAYDDSRCAYNVADGGRSVLSHQCYKKPGAGPDKLYCAAHAKKLKVYGIGV